MSEFTILSAAQVDRQVLNDFLASVYPPAKSQYLAQHGKWLYRGEENQWAVVNEIGQIVAYCAIIPTCCALQGQKTEALWWVDLIVDPAFRGRGIQTLIDKRIRAVADLKLGIPNEMAAKIHRKHGWGVREDGKMLLLPARPLGVKSVRTAVGGRGWLLRLAAAALTPLAALWRWRVRKYQPQQARLEMDPSAQRLADVFARYLDAQTVTTYRDADYIQWRYLDAPYQDELKIYTAGAADAPTHVLVTRFVHFRDTPALRILDLFGDFTDQNGMLDVLKLALRDAVVQDACQITILSFAPQLTAWLRRQGFIIGTVGRFCWHSPSAAAMNIFNGRQYWTLGDSDNDAPE